MLDLLESNVTTWMLDNPFFHALQLDPRENVRKFYKHSTFYTFKDIERIQEMNEPKVVTRERYYTLMTKNIKEGNTPEARLFDEEISRLACGHFLRLNDIMSPTFNTYLARMMDSGIVAKIFNKRFLTKG